MAAVTGSVTTITNTPGTAGGPNGRDRTLAINLLVRPKYWVKKYFAHGRFPEVGQKQKTEKEKKERKRERDRERKTEQW